MARSLLVRAERRCGALLATVDRSPGARTDSTSSKPETRYQETLRENDLHPATADRYQQLAAMPDEQGSRHELAPWQAVQHESSRILVLDDV